MKSKEVDWRGGRVVFWGLDRILETIPIEQQIGELKEDLAQVEFDGDKVLDVGWYPEFSMQGNFVVTIVRDQEWNAPVFRQKCNSVTGLHEVLRIAIEIAIFRRTQDPPSH